MPPVRQTQRMNEDLGTASATRVTHHQIPRSELQVGTWYVGRGRNSNIGRWDGEYFLLIAEAGVRTGPGPRDWTSSAVIKREPYYTAEEGCFQPFRRIDEGEIAEPLGPAGWDAHYGSSMIFKDPQS